MIATFGLLPVLMPLAAPAGDLPTLHPDGTALYLQVPDVQALADAYGQTALIRLAQDEGLGQLVAPLIGQAPEDLNLLQFGWSQAIAAFPPEVQALLPLTERLRSVSLSLDAGESSLSGLFSAADGQLDDVFDSLTIQLVVSFDSPESAMELRQALEGFLENESHVERVPIAAAEEVGGWGVEARVEYGASPCFLQIGQHLALLVRNRGPLDLNGAIARLGGVEPSEGPAAELAKARALDKVGGAVVVEGFSHLTASMLEGLDDEVPIGSLIDLAELAGGPMVTMLSRGGYWSMKLSEGRFHTAGFVPTDGAICLFGDTPIGGRAGRFIHPEAALAFVGSLDAAAMRHLMAQFLAGAGAAGEMEALDEQYGFRPDRDLIGQIQGAISISVPPLRSLMSAPTILATAELADSAAFADGLRKLGKLLADTTEDASISEGSYRGLPMFTLTFQSNPALAGGLPIDPAAMIKPTFAILDGEVLIALTEMQAKKEVRRMLKAEDGPSPILEGYDIPNAAGSVVYADWATFLGRIYTSLKALAPMLAAGGGDLPFDPSALPEADLFTKYFEPTIRYEQAGEGGTRFVEVASTGPELLLVLGGGASMGRIASISDSRAYEEAAPLAPVQPVDDGDGR